MQRPTLLRVATCYLLLGGILGCSGDKSPPDPDASVPTQPEAKVEARNSFPSVPNGFVFRPKFTTTFGEVRAGTAFVARLDADQPPLLLSVIHLLGPSGGMRKQVAAADVANVVTEVTITDRWDPSIKLSIGNRVLPILESAPLEDESGAGDVLAFRVAETPELRPARLARKTPTEGERVWLATSLSSGAPAEQRLHPATVIGMHPRGDYLYQFENAAVPIPGTSGAPVLNAAGEVVAINLGGYSEDGKKFGAGNHIERFRPYLEKALKNHK